MHQRGPEYPGNSCLGVGRPLVFNLNHRNQCSVVVGGQAFSSQPWAMALRSVVEEATCCGVNDRACPAE